MIKIDQSRHMDFSEAETGGLSETRFSKSCTGVHDTEIS